MKIKKMMYGLLAILILISFFSAFGTFAVLNQNQDNGKVVNYTGIVRGGSQRLVKLYILEEDISGQTDKIQSIISALSNGDKALGIPKPADADFKAKMQAVKSAWETNLLPKLSTPYAQANSEQLLNASESFFTIADDAVKSAEIFTENGIRLLKILSVMTFLLILSCILGIASIIRNRIINPIKEIEQGMINFSKGELQTEIAYHSANELGCLADSIRLSMDSLSGYIEDIDQAMHKMSSGNFDIAITRDFIGDFKGIETSIAAFVLKISDTFQQLSRSSDQVHVGSEQVCSAAQTLAQGATEQAASVQALSATISRISSQVNENAENSLRASELANAAMAAVTSSDTHMKLLMSTMEQMNGMSSEIGKIIKTIEDIAFQTNILALNAAVEAARAGAAGKGFAVVADEVRNLASKSAEAAKGTAVLIENSISSISSGVMVARETAEGLMQIMVHTQATQTMVASISEASKVQAKDLANTAIGVEQITSVIHSNSATSEESAASAQELSSQANLMKSFISRFKVRTEPKKTEH